MMNKGVIYVLFSIVLVLLVSSFVSAEGQSSNDNRRDYDGRLSTVIHDYYFDELFMHMNIINTGKRNIQGGKIIVYIPDLEIYWRTSTFHIQSGEKHGKFIFPEIPLNTPKGTYLAKIMFSSDRTRDIHYVWVTIE